jgi:hypothetical protein
MADDPKPGPHTVRAGVLDRLLGNRGPNGELTFEGKPVLTEDLPDDEDEDD